MKATAAARADVGWPCFDGEQIVAYIEICGEVFPYTERALWNRWERGEWIPTEWAAYFSGLAETA